MTSGGSADGAFAERGDAPPSEQEPAPPPLSSPLEEATWPEPAQVGREPSRKPFAIGAIIAVLAIATGVLGYLSVHNDSVSNRYRHLDSAEIALVHRLDAQVAAANNEMKNLNAQLTATEGHLSTVANQKAKELDLLKEASQVAGDQNACINRVQILGADLSSSLNTGQPSSQVVQSDANQVATVCEQAQQATQALQGTVNRQS